MGKDNWQTRKRKRQQAQFDGGRQGGKGPPNWTVVLDVSSGGRILMRNLHIAALVPSGKPGISRGTVRMTDDQMRGKVVQGANSYTALVDTGSTRSFVSRAVVSQENLIAHGVESVAGITGQSVLRPVHFGMMAFTIPPASAAGWPGGISILVPHVEFVLLPDDRLRTGEGVDVLLGTNCISRGSLQVPSQLMLTQRRNVATWTPDPPVAA